MKYITIVRMAVVLLFIAPLCSSASAQTGGYTFATLHSFMGTDGAASKAGLVQGSDGNFYGTTSGGGAHGNGTVFKITSAGALTTLYSFSATYQGYNADGANPHAGLTLGNDGNLYGTTFHAGGYGNGTVFKVTPAGALSALYSFGYSPDGSLPYAGLVQGSDGRFYGTTYDGGAWGAGVVFAVTSAGAETVLYSFTGLGGDGANPVANLVPGIDGSFYGTTSDGNLSYGEGAVFKITPAGGLTTLYSFTGNSDGGESCASLTLGQEGNFYGTTSTSGANGDGTVFEITPSGALTTLYSFTGGSGSWDSVSALVQGSDGSYYGTTSTGGTNGDGSVFKMTPGATPTGSTYVLWNKSGTAALWKIPNTGSTASASFGPYTGWSPTALTSDTTGNAYILWTTTTGAACVWQVSSSLNVTTSQSFGPYTGWTAKSISVGPDGHVHLLWNGPNNAASIYKIVLGSSFTTQAYGPIPGWQAQQISADSNNNTRVLWTNTSTNAASLWNITSSGTVTSQAFGPYSGWKAQDLVAGPANLPRLIWNYSSTNAASLWQMLPLGNETSTALGPISGCTPTGLAVNWDGDSDVLWTNATTGQTSIWEVSPAGTHTSTAYGPYSGWKAIAIAAGP